MGSGETRCVVGIDVAKQTHVVCALEAPGGAIRLKPSKIEASVEGYARVQEWLQSWAEPAATVIGMEATGTLWSRSTTSATQAGYHVLLLNPRQTASWASSLGLRAKTDGIDAHALARGLLAGLARPSTLPSETVQSLRALTRARRDLVQTRAAARQRLHDELVVLFPEFVPLLRQLPGEADLGAPAALHLLEAYPSAAVLAPAPTDAVLLVAQQASNGRWGEAEVALLQQAARRSAASSRAVAARSLVVRTFVGQVRHLHTQIAELEAAIQEVLRDDADARRLQGIPGIGPQGAATIRAELGDVLRFSRVDAVVAYAGLEPTHLPEWGICRAEASLQTRPRCLAPCPLSGSPGGCPVCTRVAQALPPLPRARQKQEGGPYHPVPGAAAGHLPPAAHGPNLRSYLTQPTVTGDGWLTT